MNIREKMAVKKFNNIEPRVTIQSKSFGDPATGVGGKILGKNLQLTNFLRISYEHSYELLTNFLRTSYELLANFLRTSYELLTNFLRTSYELLMNFL